MLRIKPGSSRGGASVLNHWGISPASAQFLKYIASDVVALACCARNKIHFSDCTETNSISFNIFYTN